MNKSSSKEINIYLTSHGGDLDYSFLTYDLLKQSPKTINMYCHNSVISAASIIYLAGHNRYITPNSLIMIHQLSGSISGTYNHMNDYMQCYKLSMQNMKKIYKHETTMDNRTINKLLNNDIFLNAERLNLRDVKIYR
jgi:ATP-dependent Clp protease protease subunit